MVNGDGAPSWIFLLTRLSLHQLGQAKGGNTVLL